MRLVRNRFLELLVLLLTTGLVHPGSGQEPQLKFEHLSLDDGLSQSQVECILQDSKGFIWFGTHDGLNRFDGYEFKVLKHDASDASSLSNSFIQAIVEDSDQRLWIGTRDGLNSYDLKTGASCSIAILRRSARKFQG